MIQVLLCALNARYAHTNLAIRSLSAYLQGTLRPDISCGWREWTINDRIMPLLARLADESADVYAFSCYIWNINLITQLSRELKKIRPGIVVIWGGPEAGTHAADWLNACPAVDYIIYGEGELALAGLLNTLADGLYPQPDVLAGLDGLAWRDRGRFRQNRPAPPLSGCDWCFPYTAAELRQAGDRILYYESSRGCPYSCSYCLSSLEQGVRYRPLPLVLAEMTALINAGVRQVKFVDRTFNCRPERACAIWQELVRQSSAVPRTRFHFELAGDLIDESSLAILEKAPPGLFQFEIGVQSVHAAVLAAVKRSCDLDRLAAQVKRLRQFGNCHIHLDLIAGLPGEDLPMFSCSFNRVCDLKPHTLQLGFLKVLPGTPIRQLALSRQFRWLDDPPYEVLQSDRLSFSELGTLKKIEQLLDLYMNSSQTRGAAWLAQFWPGPWDFYMALSGYFSEQQLFERTLGIAERLRHLFDFVRISRRLTEQDSDLLLELLRTDYLISGQKGRPEWLGFWEHSRHPAQQQLLRALRLTARQVLPQDQRARLHFDRISFNWPEYEGTGRMEPQDYLMVYDESSGVSRLVGHGCFAGGLPSLCLD